MKHIIKYSETYQKCYEVEADTAKKAIEKLREDIEEGRIDGPVECVGSTMEIVNRIKFGTRNCEGIRKNFEFENIESVLFEYWVNGGMDLPSIEDPLFFLEIDGKRETFNVYDPYEHTTFSYAIRTLEEEYWRSIKENGTNKRAK